MSAISFSAIEILPSLLSHEKKQTIRPLWRKEQIAKPLRFTEGNYRSMLKPIVVETKPRLKVGDEVKLYWEQTSKAKTFCSVGGHEIRDGAFTCTCVFPISKPLWFDKLLGKCKIVEVFEITMILGGSSKDTPIYFKGESKHGIYYGSEEMEDLAKRDGFKSAKEMFEWFDKTYDLSQPRRFAVYRWEYL